MRNKIAFLVVALTFGFSLCRAQHYVLSTPNTSLGITSDLKGKSYIQYYGSKISDADLQGLFTLKTNYTSESYPAFGLHSNEDKAITIQMPDGNMSLDLYVTNTEQTTDKNGKILVITMKDKVYPITVKQYFKAYNETDVITTWTDITNLGKKSVKMLRFYSAFMPLTRGDNYACHNHGTWAGEQYIEDSKLTNGMLVLSEKEGLRTAWYNNPSFMITMDGAPQEESGDVFGGSLMWGGNYKIQMIASNSSLDISAGINEEESSYTLEPKETFTTPEFAMTYSTTGKGGVSRAFHKWARKYAIQHGDKLRDVLLNSWEGVYFNVNEPVIDEMMGDIATLGGELFVMDDGWFGDKWARNNGETGLGDWMVNKKKLPNGIPGLIEAAKKHNIKFGIWIEPEMANTKSELYEKHPEWILQCKDRPLSQGRGGTQVVLDLTNPKVQDYVFGITDNLLTQNPQIAYIKWDCNCCLMDYGSTYLPANKQSEIYIRYYLGLRKVLQRIRNKYPDIVIQCCASGGGRISYGYLPYFDEYWTSDDTDAYQRLFIQWGVSQYYPAIGMSAHVSASPNHQTKREVPLKFRFDVAMTGRLGVEMQPSKMTEAERDFSKRAIAAYKSIRPVVQLGDLYRLISPYDHKPISALMYSNEDKSHCAIFAYSINFLYNQLVPYLKLNGVDENKNYRIKDLTPTDPSKPCYLDRKVVSGRILKYTGLKLNSILNHPFNSIALELTAE